MNENCKHKNVIISILILVNIILCVIAAPHQKQQSTNEPSQAITAQTVTTEMAFVQTFMQLLSQMFTQFNTIIPKFVNLFAANTPQVPAAPNLRPGQLLPASLPDFASAAANSIPNLSALQPEKISNESTNVRSPMPRDVELIENDVIETN